MGFDFLSGLYVEPSFFSPFGHGPYKEKNFDMEYTNPLETIQSIQLSSLMSKISLYTVHHKQRIFKIFPIPKCLESSSFAQFLAFLTMKSIKCLNKIMVKNLC